MQKLFAMCVALCIWTTLMADTALAFGLSALRDHLVFPPGSQTVVGSVEVTNSELQPINVEVEYTDWDLSESGETRLYPNLDGLAAVQNSSVARYSLRSYVDVFPRTLMLAPGERASIQYVIKRPSEVGGYWGALLISAQLATGVVQGENDQRFAVNLVRRYIYRIFADMQPLELGVRYTAMSAVWESSSLSTTATLSNNGNAPVTVTLQWSLQDVSGQTLFEQAQESMLVLPGAKRQFNVEWLQAPQSTAFAQVVSSFGGPKLLGARVRVAGPPQGP